MKVKEASFPGSRFCLLQTRTELEQTKLLLGAAWHRGSVYAYGPGNPGFDSSFFEKKIVDVAEVYLQHFFLESGLQGRSIPSKTG